MEHVQQVFIHVGYPKTGTSFLQEQVFPNIGEINTYWAGDKGIYEVRKLLDIVRCCNCSFEPEKIKARFSKIISKDKPALITDESLIGDVFSYNCTDMYVTMERIKNVFKNVKIIVGIRDVESITKSLYSQYIKEGGTCKMKGFTDSFLNREHRLNYKHYIKFLNKVFGKGNVYVMDFENLKKDKKKFVDDLCKFMEVKTPKYDDKKFNVKYTLWQIRIQRNINKIFKSKLNPDGLLPERLLKLVCKGVNNRFVRVLTE